MGSSKEPTILEPENARLNRVQELLDRASIIPESIGRIDKVRVKAWGVMAKDADGVMRLQGLHGTTIDIDPNKPLPIIQPATPTQIVYNEAPRILRKVKMDVVISDAQMGYLRDMQSQLLEPTHDPLAMEVARQIVADVLPTRLAFIGDWMDWPTYGRWPQFPEYDRVVQPSIEAGYRWKAEFCAASGAKSKRIEIGSNHAVRPEKFLQDYNKNAMGVRRAIAPGEWPVFSEPFLLRYDELGIEFSGQYPGGEYYLLDDLMLLHAPPKTREFAASYIHGHTHKLQAYTHVIHSSSGRKSYIGVDTGCLCQVGVTANKRRLLVTRVPSDRGRTDWAQGISVVEYIEGKLPQHQINLIAINGGRAIFKGQAYEVTRSEIEESLKING
ncbi:MAG: hypothetical protein ACREQ5_05235 [Candidatus Dormibacteria bacterium]